MDCRPNCGACCTAPSINNPIPGMPEGKAAGVRCVQLTEDERCAIFGHPDRPAFCVSLQPGIEMCGKDREEAVIWLTQLEHLTAPDQASPKTLNRAI
ncbi:MAG: YkgJ family cysteine cluster protein [Methylophilaceae bacterium]|nr:YkgJ family cysteine cluster protein [Methylophilaceae bacterium]